MKKLFFFLALALIFSNTIDAAKTVAIKTALGTLEWQTGEPGKMKWDAAKEYCGRLTLEGKNDWRLPNIRQLKTMIRQSRTVPKDAKNAFPDAHSAYYWSSTSNVNDSLYAWGVYFSPGYAANDNKDNSNYVRCVRNRK